MVAPGGKGAAGFPGGKGGGLRPQVVPAKSSLPFKAPPPGPSKGGGKWAPEGGKGAPEGGKGGGKWAPDSVKGAPEGGKGGGKWAPDGVKGAPEGGKGGGKWAPDGVKGAPDGGKGGGKWAPDGVKGAPEGGKGGGKWAPEGGKGAPDGGKGGGKWAPEGGKGAPDGGKGGGKWAPDGGKGGGKRAPDGDGAGGWAPAAPPAAVRPRSASGGGDWTPAAPPPPKRVRVDGGDEGGSMQKQALMPKSGAPGGGGVGCGGGALVPKPPPPVGPLGGGGGGWLIPQSGALPKGGAPPLPPSAVAAPAANSFAPLEEQAWPPMPIGGGGDEGGLAQVPLPLPLPTPGAGGASADGVLPGLEFTAPEVPADFEALLAQNQRILDLQKKQLDELQAVENRRKEQEEAVERRKKEAEEAEQRKEEMKKQAEEMRKQQEELQRLQEQNRIEEAEARAKALHLELAGLVETAERELQLAEEVAQMVLNEETRKELNDEEIVRHGLEFEKARHAVAASLKACNVFMAGKQRIILGATPETKKEAGDYVQRVGKVERTAATTMAQVNSFRLPAQQRLTLLAKQAAMLQEAKRTEELFKQFDSNSKGLLSVEDIIELCRVEYKFEIGEAKLELIKKSDSFRLQKGVPFAKFPALRTMLSIAQGEVLAKQRQENEVIRKKRADQQCVKIEAESKVVTESMAGIEVEVRKAEIKAGPLGPIGMQKGRPINTQLVESVLSEVDTAIEAARDFMAAAQEQLQALGNVCGGEALEAEAQRIILKTNQVIGLRLKSFETRLARPDNLAKAARGKLELQLRKEALLREASEMAEEMQ